MAITRIYRTERECAQCMVNEDYDNVASRWFLDNPAADIWFEGLRDYEDGYDDGDEELGTYGSTHCPMWSTWFQPSNSWEENWVEDHKEEIAELGFTIINVWLDGCEDIFLGIDGAGFDFYEAFWIPLYRLHGFHWHDEED